MDRSQTLKNALYLQPMKKPVKPYAAKETSKKIQVQQMFDGISDRYDQLNRVISFGIDIRWRQILIQKVLEQQPKKVLDVATGTGDLALALAQKNNQIDITGLDISAGMLDLGKEKVLQAQKSKQIQMILGDSEDLPFEDHSFDGVMVAFGVRNFENLDLGLQEIYRVLKPGGQLTILETSVPQQWFFRLGYRIYTGGIMPIIGRLFSSDKNAYSYLSDSAASFPYGEAFNNILIKNGFIEVKDYPQTLGVASIYCASKT